MGQKGVFACRAKGCTVNVQQQQRDNSTEKAVEDLSWPSGAFEFNLCVCLWQMYLRLSARPSLSISPDRALTAAQCALSMCQQTVNPMEVLSDNPSYCSFLWTLLICLSLYPPSLYFLRSLYLSLQQITVILFLVVLCFTLTKPNLLFHLSPFVIIPAHSTSHHHSYSA